MHMNQRTYYFYTGIIFAIIAIMHLVRIIYAWPVMVADVAIPLWVSWIPVLLGGYLAYRGFQLNNIR